MAAPRSIAAYAARKSAKRKGGAGMRFLVNPGADRANKGGGTMARKTPPRYTSGPKKGQFKPRGARKRSRRNPIMAKAKASTAPRRTSTGARKVRAYVAKRNPPRRGDILDTMTQGAMAAGGVLVGKAAARSLPQLLSLPQAGNVGLAVQAATAVVVGYLADRFIGPDVGQSILAGGLSAPMESLVIRLNIPWLSPALASAGTVSGYANRRGKVVVYRGGVPSVRGYVTPPGVTAPSGVAGYGYGYMN